MAAVKAKIEIGAPSPEIADWMKVMEEINRGNLGPKLSELLHAWLNTHYSDYNNYNDHKIWMRLMNLGVEPGHTPRKRSKPDYSIEGFSRLTITKILKLAFPEEYKAPEKMVYDGMNFHVTVGSKTEKVSGTHIDLVDHFNRLIPGRKKFEKAQHALDLYIRTKNEHRRGNRLHALCRIYNASSIVRDCLNHTMPYANIGGLIKEANVMKEAYKVRENARRKEREKAQVAVIMKAVREFIEESDHPGMAFGLADMVTYYARHMGGPAAEKFIKAIGEEDIHLGFHHKAFFPGKMLLAQGLPC